MLHYFAANEGMHYGINQKTVPNGRRGFITDLPMGPREPKSMVLSVGDEAIIVVVRRHTLLPIEDYLYALQATIPHLTRSSLHHHHQLHGTSRLPRREDAKVQKRKFRAYTIGCFHVDIAEVRRQEGKLYLFVAIDRTSTLAFIELHEKATRRVSADFLMALIIAIPYKIHTALTDNGTHFTEPSGNFWRPTKIKAELDRQEIFRAHSFELACAENGIDHRLTKLKCP